MYDYETPYQKEQRLYKESRALKFQAREMRKVRLRREAEAKAFKEREEKRKAEQAAKDAKKSRDDRIRKALLGMADVAKHHDIAFEAPEGYGTVPANHAFYIIDRKSGQRVSIKTHPTGFSWD